MEAPVAILKMFGKKNSNSPVNSDMDKQRKYEALVRGYHPSGAITAICTVMHTGCVRTKQLRKI